MTIFPCVATIARMNRFRLIKANGLRSLFFFCFLIATMACAQQPNTPPIQPQPSPIATQIILVVATASPSTTTASLAPTVTPSNTPQLPTATIEPTQTVPPTEIPATQTVPPTEIPATQIPAT